MELAPILTLLRYLESPRAFIRKIYCRRRCIISSTIKAIRHMNLSQLQVISVLPSFELLGDWCTVVLGGWGTVVDVLLYTIVLPWL
jgi:hypothetical protein